MTSSQWTVPLWNPPAVVGQQGTWSTGTWRWMLDYATDRHGNAIAYFYNQQANWYAQAGGTTGTGQYTRGGTLAKITYGFQDGHAYDQTPPGQVTFTTTGGRQDAPADLACSQGAACSVTSPTFWTDQQLTTVATQALVGSAQQQVDSWSLSQTFPATSDPLTAPSLWLSSITQTGQDGSTPITLPPTQFAGTPMPNRVMTSADTTAGYSPITRFRLTSLTNTTGGVTTIKYTPADAACAAGNFPASSANATQCYPDWLPAGVSGPVQDWFNLYAVQTSTVTDTTGGDPPIVTTYTSSGPAWHYNTDTVTRSATVTWDQWRGFRTITTQTGTAPDPVTQVTDTYFQGKSKDCGASSCTGPVVTLTSTRGTTADDSNQYAGKTFEEITYNGAGGAQVTDVIYNATTIATTATGSGTWAGVTANIVDDNAVSAYTALAGGSTRQSTTNYTFDSNGRVTQETDVPDVSDPAQSTCATNSYSAFDLIAEQDRYSLTQDSHGNWACQTIQTTTTLSALQAHAVSATSNTYDSSGNLTQVSRGTGFTSASTAQCPRGWTAPYCWSWQTTHAATYDQYGRVLTQTDADNRTSTTAYIPATGAEPSSVQVTDPMNLATTTTYDPVRNLPLTVTDPAGYQTVKAYDALGRPTSVWTPGNPASGPAVGTFSYTVSNTAPSVTTQQTETPGGGYLTTESISDSLGQVREIQTQTASGGSDVTDTSYNSGGQKALVSSPYYVSAAPSGTLVSAASSSIPSQTGNVYDGDGRLIKQIAYKLGTETWETDAPRSPRRPALRQPAMLTTRQATSPQSPDQPRTSPSPGTTPGSSPRMRSPQLAAPRRTPNTSTTLTALSCSRRIPAPPPSSSATRNCPSTPLQPPSPAPGSTP